MKYENRTTKALYEKYAELAEESHISLKGTKKFLGIRTTPCNLALANARDDSGNPIVCGACWHCMYRMDNVLNNVPLPKWEGIVYSYWGLNKRKVIRTLGEGVSTYKHIVIYEVVGAIPVFTDDEADNTIKGKDSVK